MTIKMQGIPKGKLAWYFSGKNMVKFEKTLMRREK
jgi:hypothetical protein